MLAEKSGFEKGALVFVRLLSDRADSNENDYPSAFILNSPNLAGPDTVCARYVGPETQARLQELFPNRPIWIIKRIGSKNDFSIPFS